MVKMVVVVLKEILELLDLLACLEDLAGMEFLVLLDLQGLWLKGKKSLVHLVLLDKMECQANLVLLG